MSDQEPKMKPDGEASELDVGTLKATHLCSFCGKSNNEARQIVTGESDVCICDECIELARDVIGSIRIAQHGGKK